MESETDDQKRSTELLDEVRRAASALVEREAMHWHSRMVGYEMVGAMIGASPIWVRRFVNRDERATLNYVVGHNIMALYRRVTGKTE